MSLKSRALGMIAKTWDRMPVAWRRRVLFASNDHFLVGVVGLIVNEKQEVLLLEHRFRTPWRWGLPGGFIDRGESAAQGLLRELHEEIGLSAELEPEVFDTEINAEGGYVSLTLAGRLIGAHTTTVPRSAEIVSGGFYGPENLPSGLYPYHRQLLKRFWSRRPIATARGEWSD